MMTTYELLFFFVAEPNKFLVPTKHTIHQEKDLILFYLWYHSITN